MILPQYLYIFRSTLFAGVFWLISISVIAQIENPVADSLLLDSSDSTSVLIQEGEVKSATGIDSLAKKKFISGLELAIDYGKLMTLWTQFESKYEAGINVRFFERVVLAGEVGYDELNPLKAYDNAVYYTVTGSYARIGLDYYTSYNPKSFYYGGVRYGMSMFEDEGVFLIDSEYWEDYEDGFGSTDITASWGEIILGTETYLKLGKKNPEDPTSKLLLGWKFRLRILMDFENREEPRIYSIPGYGRTFDKSVPAVNFYIKYRFGS